jgi:hypothetical protein
MQGLIINTALILTRSIQKNISLILPFLSVSLFTYPLDASDLAIETSQAKIIGDRT